MIYFIGPTATGSDDASGCMAIGSGSNVALSTLLTSGQSRDSTLSETLYRIAVTKFMSEKSEGEFVGRNTAIHISWKCGPNDPANNVPGVSIQVDPIKELRTVWEEHGRPKIPDQARMVAASILARMGIATAQDMMSAVGAAARLPNQPEGDK